MFGHSVSTSLQANFFFKCSVKAAETCLGGSLQTAGQDPTIPGPFTLRIVPCNFKSNPKLPCCPSANSTVVHEFLFYRQCCVPSLFLFSSRLYYTSLALGHIFPVWFCCLSVLLRLYCNWCWVCHWSNTIAANLSVETLASFCCSGCILRDSQLAEVTLQISVTATFLSSGRCSTGTQSGFVLYASFDVYFHSG